MELEEAPVSMLLGEVGGEVGDSAWVDRVLLCIRPSESSMDNASPLALRVAVDSDESMDGNRPPNESMLSNDPNDAESPLWAILMTLRAIASEGNSPYPADSEGRILLPFPCAFVPAAEHTDDAESIPAGRVDEDAAAPIACPSGNETGLAFALANCTASLSATAGGSSLRARSIASRALSNRPKLTSATIRLLQSSG